MLKWDCFNFFFGWGYKKVGGNYLFYLEWGMRCLGSICKGSVWELVI